MNSSGRTEVLDSISTTSMATVGISARRVRRRELAKARSTELRRKSTRCGSACWFVVLYSLGWIFFLVSSFSTLLIYLSDCDLRPLGLNVHFIIVHDGRESRRAKAGFLPCGMVLERRLLRIHERGDGSAQVVKSTKPYRKDGLVESFFGVGDKMSGEQLGRVKL